MGPVGLALRPNREYLRKRCKVDTKGFARLGGGGTVAPDARARIYLALLVVQEVRSVPGTRACRVGP